MPDHHRCTHEALKFGTGANLRQTLASHPLPNTDLQNKVEEIYAVAVEQQHLIATLLKRNAEFTVERDGPKPLLEHQREAIRERCQALMDKTTALLIDAFGVAPK